MLLIELYCGSHMLLIELYCGSHMLLIELYYGVIGYFYNESKQHKAKASGLGIFFRGISAIL